MLPFPQYRDLCATILDTLSGPGWEISEATQLYTSGTPISLWNKFGASIGLNDALLKEISAEFESSIKWQSWSCNPVNADTLVDLMLRVFL
jgi:hypothetical protein